MTDQHQDGADKRAHQSDALQETVERNGERTRRASFDPVSGEVHGSGSGAGGGNPGEDYDSDPMGGGRAKPHGGPRTIDKATRKPEDKHQGDAA